MLWERSVDALAIQGGANPHCCQLISQARVQCRSYQSEQLQLRVALTFPNLVLRMNRLAASVDNGMTWVRATKTWPLDQTISFVLSLTPITCSFLTDLAQNIQKGQWEDEVTTFSSQYPLLFLELSQQYLGECLSSGVMQVAPDISGAALYMLLKVAVKNTRLQHFPKGR